MRIVLAALAGLVLITTPGLAQESTSVFQLLDRARAAHTSGNAREAERLAEQAVAAASSPSERFNALVVYGDLLTDAGDHRNAYELYSRVLELVEENDPENVAALELALGRKGSAAMQLGRRDEWLALGERIMELNRAGQAPLWRFEDTAQVRHRLSGYPCPESAYGLVREELVSYNSTGTDVACRYAVADTPGPAVTAHAFLTGADQESAYQAGLAGMLRNFSGARRQDEGEVEIGGVPVRYGIYRQSRVTAGVWTTQIGEWTLKLRITHQGELRRAQMDSAAQLAFAGAGDVARHLAHCASVAGDGRYLSSLTLDEALETAVTLLATEMAAEADPSWPSAPDALQCYVADAAFSPSGGIIVARIDDDGQLLDYRADPHGATGIYLQALPARGQGADARGLEDGNSVGGSARWILRQISPERTGIYGAFDATPSPEVFQGVVEAILDGTVRVVVWLSENEAGNLQINLVEPAEDDAAE
ncbi:tetratricopeptide repeat protein [Glycocaulis sp.]|uniref:tetratricopeptide repeat protein n=1 Tax=Glycocaulis sp. TaxID=1969725 RepID=UPI003F6E8368